MDEMVTCVKEYYLNKIPYIVKCKLREFDENNLSRHAVPTLAFFTKRFFNLPESTQNEIIEKYIQALEEVGIMCIPITDRPISGKGWYLRKEA